MQQLVIDRSKWLCGRKQEQLTRPFRSANGDGPIRLLNGYGFKCCLGFAAQQLDGATDTDILGLAFPSNIVGIAPNSPTVRVEIPAAAANDDCTLTFEEREKIVAELFAEHGVEVTFTGEYKNVTQPA